MGRLLEGDLAIGHLLRRAGFGPSPRDLGSWRALGYTEAVLRLVDGLGGAAPPDPPGFDPYLPGAIQQTWLERMASGASPLAEKLALFWHGHFATSDAKIQEPFLMWRQYGLFRALGAGRFSDLVVAVGRDVAMIRWLDGNANRKGAPNENYARELQELFTLGIGHYTENDIREIARAFTGCGSRHHDFVFTEAFHDGGTKTIHGRTGEFGPDDVGRLLAALPACHLFLARKLLAFFSHESPTDAEVRDLAEVLDRTEGDIRSALLVIFLSPAFRAPERHRALVKSPVEFVVGALRAVGESAVPLWAHGALERMGQILFRPPSVKGWPSGAGWLNSAAMVERVKTAHRLAAAHPAASATILAMAFDGAPPPGIAAPSIALALASPEYQLN